MRTRYFLVLIVAAALVSACRSNPKPAPDPKEPWTGTYRAAHRVVSPAHGTVGFVKTFEFAKEGAGEPFRLFRVYDLDFEERGVISAMGRATKYVDLPPEIARAKGKTRELEELPAQPLEYNAAVILDVPTDVKLVRMTPEEFAAMAE